MKHSYYSRNFWLRLMDSKVMPKLALATIVLFTLLAGCSGKDKSNKDTTAPYPPKLVAHLGDTGDYPIIYNGNELTLTEENNGIDTVPDGDWIRVLWEPFLDTDLSHIRIYRFDQFNPEPVMIDSLSASARQYVDSRNALNVETVYSYYIDLVDFSGNSARSDTVAYAILSKCQLVSPENNATVTPGAIVFKWDRSGFATRYRALVFDENHNYVWHQDIVVSFEDDLSIPFPVNLAEEYSGRSLIWRIDSFDVNNELLMDIGSESNIRTLHIQ